MSLISAKMQNMACHAAVWYVANLCDFYRWRSMIPDVLVMLTIAVFGVSVGRRVHHITSRHNRHLWRLLYEKTGLVLDLTIVVLQTFSKMSFESFASLFILSCCLSGTVLMKPSGRTHSFS